MHTRAGPVQVTMAQAASQALKSSCIMIEPRPGMAESVRIIIYGCDTSTSSTRRKRFLFVVLLI